LGHLSPGALADIAVLRVEKGKFGFVDMNGARMPGSQKFLCEMTLLEGKIVYDLNGLARPNWDALPKDYGRTGDPRWEGGGRPARRRQ
jgi:dihydroorotase